MTGFSVDMRLTDTQILKLVKTIGGQFAFTCMFTNNAWVLTACGLYVQDPDFNFALNMLLMQLWGSFSPTIQKCIIEITNNEL